MDSTTSAHPTTTLLKFQIGPVQDFIQQARSTRDLWSGSYLLSWLVSVGLRKLVLNAGKESLIFPNPENQPLLHRSPDEFDLEALLTPNLPNVFVALLPRAEARAIAVAVQRAIESEWKEIAIAVWQQRHRFHLGDRAETRFFAQVERHLSIDWQITSIESDYASAFGRNGHQLDAVRQTRAFRAWHSAEGLMEKDALSGKEEAVLGGSDFRELCEKYPKAYTFLFAKHADYMGAASVIKRVWHLAYLEDRKHLPATSRPFSIRSIPDIAARCAKFENDEPQQQRTPGDAYFAALAFDGDSIGKWINGDDLPFGTDLQSHHARFSAALTDFALNRVRTIVEQPVPGRGADDRPAQVPLGQLIYAGGDDVIALVPADAALATASRLRAAFREATAHIRDKNGYSPDASVGIAIGHIHAPLQDLVRKAKRAERRAKTEGPRPAFSVTLMKRSGEITHWTARWADDALPLHDAIFAEMRSGELSARFPHRLTELISLYLTHSTQLSTIRDGNGFDLDEVLCKEFRHAATRQGSAEIAERLLPLLEAHLSKLQRPVQPTLQSLIGLLTTLAFTFRNLPSPEASVAS